MTTSAVCSFTLADLTWFQAWKLTAHCEGWRCYLEQDDEHDQLSLQPANAPEAVFVLSPVPEGVEMTRFGGTSGYASYAISVYAGLREALLVVLPISPAALAVADGLAVLGRSREKEGP